MGVGGFGGEGGERNHVVFRGTEWDQSSLTEYREKGRLYKIVYQGGVSLKYYRVYDGDQVNLTVTTKIVRPLQAIMK